MQNRTTSAPPTWPYRTASAAWRTDWHNLIFYRQLAKIVEQYVHKGDKLYIEGRLRYNTYDDKHGKRHDVTEIMVDNMELLSPRPNKA